MSHIAERRALERELEQARATLAGRAPHDAARSVESPAIRRVLDKVDAVAGSDAPALIVGESGTGKELVARMIHDRSARRGRPYVAVNCGALTETLMEAELFGHERGAFTGAERKREGRFKAADGGTIFLDEVAELPLSAQAKLLRVLQEGTFEPLGSNTTVKVDVRVVSATHRNLRERVQRRPVPRGPLLPDQRHRDRAASAARAGGRPRPADAATFWIGSRSRASRTPRISTAAWDALTRHPFPGNVRELSHAIQHAVVLAAGGEILAEHLPGSVTAPDGEAAAAEPADQPGAPVALRPLSEAMRDLERDYLVEVMRQCRDNKTRAAFVLGIGAKTLDEKLKLHRLTQG